MPLQTLERCRELMPARLKRSEGGCLNWDGPVTSKGYGLGMKADGKYVRAHRLAYRLHVGAIPAGAHVLHHCDNRRCCEPTHLYLGSNEENIVDKMVRDRSGKKLCREQVARIKARLAAGESRRSLASAFGVNPSNITRIATGERWAHVLMKKENVSYLGA